MHICIYKYETYLNVYICIYTYETSSPSMMRLVRAGRVISILSLPVLVLPPFPRACTSCSEKCPAFICVYKYIYIHEYLYVYINWYIYRLLCTYIRIYTYIYIHTNLLAGALPAAIPTRLHKFQR